jgi:hypothetical protein
LFEGRTGHIALNVEVEAINNSVAEWSRFASVDPSCGFGAESAPKKLGKVLSYGDFL